MKFLMKKLLIIFCLLWLSACQSGLKIDKNHVSQAQDNRIQYIVVHYTAADLMRSLHLLTQANVSSHYLISKDGTIYQLVNDEKRAWHAGISEWQGRNSLNNSSIGIELVNLGYKETPQKTRIWYRYSDAQIKSLKALLRELQKRYDIPSKNILGHSDVAPQRKSDPGPLFPWRELAKEGLAIWPDEGAVARQQAIFDAKGLPSTTWVQNKLANIGYATPQTGKLDPDTVKAIIAFQMRYQPDNFTGIVDSKTAALLFVVANKNFATPK